MQICQKKLPNLRNKKVESFKKIEQKLRGTVGQIKKYKYMCNGNHRMK
jgi:hypothetical protein